MPLKKRNSRKNIYDSEEKRADIPTKEEVSKQPKLKIVATGKKLQQRLVTTFANARKKKRPKHKE